MPEPYSFMLPPSDGSPTEPRDAVAARRESWELDATRQVGSFLIITRTAPLPAAVDAACVIALPHRRVVRCDAFGTGRHPATQVALLLVSSAIRGGSDVLDLQAGSGILAVAAGRAGARRVVAVDSDASARAVARETVRVNALERVINISAFVPAGERYDSIIVHPDAGCSHSGAGALRELLTPGGIVLVAGVPESRRVELLRKFSDEGLTLRDERRVGALLGFILAAPLWHVTRGET
jgi:ribosomal protein L11 methylase PrmA